MHAIVVGYGSIGARHARILNELGCTVGVVSRRAVDFPRVYPSLSVALQESVVDYVIVANKTVQHATTFRELVDHDFRGKVLVEKPLFHETISVPEHRFQIGGVAYNLRFHPLLQRVRQFIETEKLISLQAYVGQYLPTWRPKQDYRQSYSALKTEGGGVLRDLSHELDYLLWLLGGWSDLSVKGGHYSDLEIDCEDVVALLFSSPRCPIVMLQMNYLDRLGQRKLIINSQAHTLVVDLVNGQLTIDDQQETFQLNRDETYRLQHLAVLNGDPVTLCSLNEGEQVLHFIRTIERFWEN